MGGLKTGPSRRHRIQPAEGPLGVFVAQLVLRHSCVADRLPVVVRFPASPRVSLKSGDQPKGRWRRKKKRKKKSKKKKKKKRKKKKPAEGPFLDPPAEETCFKKGSESGPLEIKSGPSWRVQFWSLFVPLIVANLLRRLFQVEVDLTSNSCSWNLELFEALIANSMLVCVTLMCFYIGTAQLKKVHGRA